MAGNFNTSTVQPSKPSAGGAEQWGMRAKKRGTRRPPGPTKKPDRNDRSNQVETESHNQGEIEGSGVLASLRRGALPWQRPV
ncbi:uncharacterized protein N7458_012442 [Penicillium daleae]|uniref:Uncharacterized protein n=1 Tax=Penicillium daleae TaxID=63821 RepID=A0AAD6BWF3_9EURO|nr:uncharacterized protein N7458_012442 [Penicillium daleae]KAJ5433286.1 hypothetical protein N7458_012442 [Penicillium daleae]